MYISLPDTYRCGSYSVFAKVTGFISQGNQQSLGLVPPAATVDSADGNAIRTCRPLQPVPHYSQIAIFIVAIEQRLGHSLSHGTPLKDRLAEQEVTSNSTLCLWEGSFTLPHPPPYWCPQPFPLPTPHAPRPHSTPVESTSHCRKP